MTRQLRLLLGMGALAGILAACGVPSDSNPQVIAARDVPYGLIGSSTSQPTPTQPPGPTANAIIYLVKQGHLVARTRQVRTPVSISKAVEALLGGPTDAEAAQDIQTAIGPSAAVLSTTVTAGLVTINMNRAFGLVGGQNQITEVAQLVFTATAQPPIGAVSFELQGQPVPVPDGEGTLTNRPLTRRDFPALAPL